MGFTAAAALFEGYAKRERNDPDRKARLLETARLYRKLAAITPDFPPGYRHEHNKDLSSASDRGQDRADECRAIADCMTTRNAARKWPRSPTVTTG
jgi:hypothetical protein